MAAPSDKSVCAPRWCFTAFARILSAGQTLEEIGLLLGSTGYPSPRFENSAAYLASWVEKLENDLRMIIPAASQVQRSADFALGIGPKESLQECQISPEGMPLT